MYPQCWMLVLLRAMDYCITILAGFVCVSFLKEKPTRKLL